MWKCGNVKMWKCGNVKMRRCENEKMRKILILLQKSSTLKTMGSVSV
jgi:hypothetical protein